MTLLNCNIISNTNINPTLFLSKSLNCNISSSALINCDLSVSGLATEMLTNITALSEISADLSVFPFIKSIFTSTRSIFTLFEDTLYR